MRIAHWVRAGNKYGSLEKYFVAFSQLSAQRAYPFALLSEIENRSSEYRSSLNRHGVTWLTVGESEKDLKQVFGEVTGFVRTWKPDLVHLHFINPVAVPFLKVLGVPLVYQTYHSGIDHRISFSTRLIRWVNNYLATQIYAVSEKVKQDEVRAGVLSRKISVSYLGLPFDLFESQAQLLEQPIPPFLSRTDLRKIITVGRFFPIKGMRYVVDAAISVLERTEKVVWWLVGKGGPDLPYCQERVQAAGLEGRIFFLGERNDVPALLRYSHLQVIGSLHEGFGLMALEAASMSVPTIGPAIKGLDEAILDGKSGLLVPPRSGSALADATLKVLSDPKLWSYMSHFARNYVRNRFDSKQSIAAMLDDYARHWISYSLGVL